MHRACCCVAEDVAEWACIAGPPCLRQHNFRQLIRHPAYSCCAVQAQRALEVLRRPSVSQELHYKFAPALVALAPQLTVQAWMDAQPPLEPRWVGVWLGEWCRSRGACKGAAGQLKCPSLRGPVVQHGEGDHVFLPATQQSTHLQAPAASAAALWRARRRRRGGGPCRGAQVCALCDAAAGQRGPGGAQPGGGAAQPGPRSGKRAGQPLVEFSPCFPLLDSRLVRSAHWCILVCRRKAVS